MLNELKSNPLLSAATLLAAIMVVADTYAKYLPISPFWFDVIVVAMLMYTLCHWALLVAGRLRRIRRLQERKQLEEASLTGGADDRQITVFSAFLQAARPTIVLVAILALVCIWMSMQPTAHVVNNTAWEVCGSFASHCQVSPCFQFLDSKKRSITGRCYVPADVSGYLSLESPAWTTYKPHYVLQRCGQQDSDLQILNDQFFSGNCDQRMVFQ